jgi:hypothetical protein
MSKDTTDDAMQDEYDFSNGVRGKYAQRFHEKSNVIMLEPDVAEEFSNSEAVNQALRGLIAMRNRKKD